MYSSNEGKLIIFRSRFIQYGIKFTLGKCILRTQNVAVLTDYNVKISSLLISAKILT